METFGLIFILTTWSSLTLAHIENKARYDNYRLYVVNIDQPYQRHVIYDTYYRSGSYTLMGSAGSPGKLVILVPSHKIPDFVDILDRYFITSEIWTYNFQETIDNQWKDVSPKDTPPENLDWDHYFHLETIYAWMEKLAKDYNFVSIVEIGVSAEGIPIKGVKLAKNESNTAVFVEAGIHSREWIAPATSTFILNELLTSQDPKVKKYASEFNWFFFPVVNPDGYKYSFESDRLWRKNRNLLGLCRGVNLNRNFPIQWNQVLDNGNPCDNYYSGPYAGSELETQAIIQFIKNFTAIENIRTYLALHSFSQLVLFPYGYTSAKVLNYNDLDVIAAKAAEKIYEISGRVYKSGDAFNTIYSIDGISQDWAHTVAKIPITLTIELRGPRNSTELFILPANQIRETGQEILGAFLTILEEAEKFGYYDIL